MNIRKNIEDLMQEIESLRTAHNIDYPIHIIAVTKTRTVQEVRQAIEAGMTQIGENRVQEAETKFKELGPVTVKKRLIGHLQENKANKAAELFDTVDSLDSIKTARKLNNKCKDLDKKMEVLIEVNTSGESSKHGLQEAEVRPFINELKELSQLDIRGFMTIGPLTQEEAAIRAAFKQLYRIRSEMKAAYPDLTLDELSMGMSSDYAIAIQEGSTMIRPGTLLFGHRDY